MGKFNMWTVVYMSQNAEDVIRIKLILENNEIISRVRNKASSSDENSKLFEIMVPSQELSLAQNLIIAQEV